MRLCDRWTTLWIALVDVDPPRRGAPVVVIPHGHYRPWFDGQPREVPVRGRLVHVGLVRRYKGIDALLRAFSALAGEDLSLRIVGSTIDEDVAAEIRSAVAADGRISTLDAYLSEDALVREITASELVVLPFAGVTNSGSLLLGAVLDRPVLVRSQPLTEQLAAEAGPGGSSPSRVPRSRCHPPGPGHSAGPAVTGGARSVGPGWDAIGAAHALAFETALAGAQRRLRGRGRL